MNMASPPTVLAALAILSFSGAMANAADAGEHDVKFFRSVEGQWSGPGEVVAGKYKGTRFTCDLVGTVPARHAGMNLDGTCRVGMFTQKMAAHVEERGRSGYRGTFLDGAAGKGLDVIGGSVEGKKVVFVLNRHQLKGTMLAHLPDPNTMNVTISVKVNDDLVPVIGVSLKRDSDHSAKRVAQE
jgi:hypothetical protein